MTDYNILTKTDNTKLVNKFLHAQKDVEKAVEKPTIDFVEKVLNKVFSSFGTIHTSYDYNSYQYHSNP